MTISGEVKQSLASLKGVKATLESYVSIEDNLESKAVLTRNTERLDRVIKDLENRVSVLEFEEPQYKGF
jgi:nitrogen-specific signal transduction histidine kinase